jgi:nucleotide-binding universal stress UspA family protein
MQIAYGEVCVSGDLIALDRADIAREMKETEAVFREALAARVTDLRWRSIVTLDSLSAYVAGAARGADLVLTAAAKMAMNSARRLDVGDLVMRAGRPVLVVPGGGDTVRFDRIVIGWKDTRETRRAAFDALPLLKKATQVSVVEIAVEGALADARAHLDEVVGWLKRHGVAANSFAVASAGDDIGRLDDFAREHCADVVVAGAYGHSRLREWMLGGVTQDLLLREDRCALLSH